MKASLTVALLSVFLSLAAALSGCFYPPSAKAPTPAQSSIMIGKPFDLVWDATHQVIAANSFRLVTEDPASGLIETQASGGFTLKDADCGELRSVANKYQAEPGIDATVVYNFYVIPAGDEATSVSVQSTFDAPLQIPLRPTTDVQCVSRGKQEARLLKAIAEKAKRAHRPTFVRPAAN
ncbi:MAG TPA: hypothetical protein VHY56_06205 [Candidatus Binataceae bacterium]|nr:hypothetical protein [Candidatus Binataceae bacterium]